MENEIIRLARGQRYFLEDAVLNKKYGFYLSSYSQGSLEKVTDYNSPGCYIFMWYKGEGSTGNALFDIDYIGQGADKKKRACMNGRISRFLGSPNAYILTTTEDTADLFSENLRKSFEERLKYLIPPVYESEHRAAANCGRELGNSNMISIRGNIIIRINEKYRGK